MPLSLTIANSDEQALRSIYERRSKEALINYIIEQKLLKRLTLTLIELRGMSREELIEKAVEIHKYGGHYGDK